MRLFIKSLLVISLFLAVCNMAMAQPETTIFVVRHAEKSLESTDDPNLSDVGQSRAERLHAMLRDAGITAIYSTDTKRTRQTVEPLARALGLPLTLYKRDDTTFPQSLTERHNGQRILVVGHAVNVPVLLNTLLNTTTRKPSDEYSDLYIVRQSEGKPTTLLNLHY